MGNTGKKNCEKNTGKEQWEITVGNKTKGKNQGKIQGKEKRCDARLTKNTGELRWS